MSGHIEGLLIAKGIVEKHRDAAVASRIFHLNRGPRLANIEACLAACKVAWFDAVIRDLNACAPTPIIQPGERR